MEPHQLPPSYVKLRRNIEMASLSTASLDPRCARATEPIDHSPIEHHASHIIDEYVQEIPIRLRCGTRHDEEEFRHKAGLLAEAGSPPTLLGTESLPIVTRVLVV